jgi:adenosine 3'-phospho 5'-phosphosulfate transporter B3
MSNNNHDNQSEESLLSSDSMNSKRSISNNSIKEPINILCFDISKLSRTWQFLILTFATFVFYLLYGYVQELMYKLEDFNKYAWYLTLVQFLFYTLFGFTESKIRNDFNRK